jgi:hypothetical protein
VGVVTPSNSPSRGRAKSRFSVFTAELFAADESDSVIVRNIKKCLASLSSRRGTEGEVNHE